MARSSANISILQFGHRHISALRVKPSTRDIRVLDHIVESGDWSVEDGSLGEALKNFVDVHGLAADRVFTVVPRHDVTARILELPSQDAGEIDGMVRLSAPELVPYPPDELVISHAILGKTADGESRVLVVVAHHDIVERHIGIAHAAGVNPEKLLLSTACLVDALSSDAEDTDDYRAYANLSSGGLEVVVLQGSRLVFARGVATDTSWETTDETRDAVVAELTSEIRSSLSTQRRESLDGRGASELFLASDVTDSAQLADLLAHEIDVSVVPATGALDQVVQGAEALKGIPLVALGAVRTAQGAGSCSIDLTPRGELARRAVAGLRTRVLRTLAAVALLFVALGAYYGQAVHQRETYLKELERRADRLRPVVQAAVYKRRHLEQVQRGIVRKESALELLAALCEIAPPKGINITGYSYRKGDGIDVYGRSLSLTLIDQLTEDLREAGRAGLHQFAQASKAYSHQIAERNEEVWNYSITLPFLSDTDEEANSG